MGNQWLRLSAVGTIGFASARRLRIHLAPTSNDLSVCCNHRPNPGHNHRRNQSRDYNHNYRSTHNRGDGGSDDCDCSGEGEGEAMMSHGPVVRRERQT
ncbi:hypothetical protein LMG28690_01066 [Paraburkholderia caffeinilytica]|nr:hypothetical protein LMG28690_01066 [Paraburkholderia caffeinilytica]